MKRTSGTKAEAGRKAKPETSVIKTGSAALPERILVGVDVGLRKYAICRQVDGSMQEPPQTKTPKEFKEWILGQKAKAREVVVCYEAGFLGFELARWLVENGIQCVVMSPVKLDEGNKRVETDNLNARDIAGRLDRYLAGNKRAMTVCRIPTRREELDRHTGRQRQQLLDHRKSLEAQGRSLLWQFGCLEDGEGRWWSEKRWQSLGLEAEMMERLGRLRAVILELERQQVEVEEKLAAQAAAAAKAAAGQAPKLPLGVGWLSMRLLTLECMDWSRFKNRRQVACFSGLVPSEGSTGESRRQGSVTKVGNPVVRMVLVEMAWRLVRYQPGCHAVKPWLETLRNKAKNGARTRKRAIVAVARRLVIDLWRLATGQTTAGALGFV